MPALMSRERSEFETFQAGRRPGSQDGVVAFGGRPHRPGFVAARDHAGRHATGREQLETSAQPVEGHHARIEHGRVFAAERPVPHAVESRGARGPMRRRIDDQQRAPLAAEAAGDQQRRQPDILLARQRRNAQQVDVRRGMQREDAGAGLRRADDVVVGDRPAIVAIGIGGRVADHRAVRGRRRTRRPLGGHAALHANQARLEQRVGDEAIGARRDGQPPEDLLVLDLLGSRGAHPLHHQVEAVVILRLDAVVVDRGAQEFARTGADAAQDQPAAAVGSVSVGGRAPLTTRTMTAQRPPFSKNCSTA